MDFKRSCYYIHFLNNNPKEVTQPTTWLSPLAYLYFDIFLFVFWYLCIFICFLIVLQKRWHSRPPGLGLECSTRSVLLGPSEPLQPQSLLIFFHWQLVGLGVQDLDLVPFFEKVGRTLACLDNREAGFSNVPSYHVKHKQQLRLKTPLHLVRNKRKS